MNASTTILITGAGSGIGKATALKLLDEGYNLIVHHYHSERGAREVAAHGKRMGRKVSCIRADFSSIRGVPSLLAGVKRTGLPLAAIVHCAGVHEKKAYSKVSQTTFARVFSVNTAAPIFLSQHLLSCLEKSNTISPSIILIGSSYSFIGGGDKNVLYTASKSALIGVTKTLAKLLAPDIRVNCVIPGFIESDMLFENATPSYLNKKWERVPLRRFGTPRDVADTICFLLSEKAQYITGQSVHVNGGVYLG